MGIGAHDPEQPRVLGLVAHAGEVGAKRGAADLVERRDQRALRGCGDDRLERRQHALAVGLAERNEPHAGRNQVGGERMQIGVQRRLERDAVSRAGDADRDRIARRRRPRPRAADRAPAQARRRAWCRGRRGPAPWSPGGAPSMARRRRRARRRRAAPRHRRRRSRDEHGRTTRRRKSRRPRRSSPRASAAASSHP